MSFVPADEIINVLKKNLGLDEKTYALFKIWEKELGSLSKSAEIAGLKNGRLVVEVASSAHFQELTLRKRELTKKINQYFGSEKFIKEIKLKLKK